MAALRKPLQGVGNIVRFNWHFYLGALVLATGIIGLGVAEPDVRGYVAIGLGLLLAPVLVSLAVSAYAYDLIYIG